jgi:hypothetical protein
LIYKIDPSPGKRTGTILIQRPANPYGNLWGESYSVESVQSATHVTSESVSGDEDLKDPLFVNR